MHGIADEVRRDEDVAGEARLERGVQGFCVGNDEPEAVAMHRKAAGDQILVRGGGGKCIAIGVDLDQRAAGDQFLQTLVQLAPLSPM